MPRFHILVLAFLSTLLASCSTQPSATKLPPASSKETSPPPDFLPVPPAQAAAEPPIKPSKDIGLAQILRNLPISPDRDRSLLSVRSKSFARDSIFAEFLGGPIPIEARREIVLQLSPHITAADLDSLLASQSASAVSTLPELGVIVIQVPEYSVDPSGFALEDPRSLPRTRLAKLVAQLQSDPRVLAAVPNSILSSFSLSAALVPHSLIPPNHSVEVEDWGMADSHISELWPTLQKPVRVGMIDTGFSAHEDVKIERALNLPVRQVSMRTANHGTHVAGIMCALHNGFGVRGVLPNCTVVASETRELLASTSNGIQGTDSIAWAALFSEYIGTVLDFMKSAPQVRVINLSVGYNWMERFNLDPRTNPQLQDIVRGQGRIYESLLEFAADHDVALVSAAGNDSNGLQTPLQAKWGSPFNFGSDLMLAAKGWSSGLVVQAHDRLGKRASFSNSNGDISCPGVDILSTLASPQNGFGYLSGTSMAAPYCAGALMALREAVPDVGFRASLRCIRASDQFIEGVPKLNLKYAVEHCKERATDAANDQAEAMRHWIASVSATPATNAANTSSGCTYGMRAVFRVTSVTAYSAADGQTPVITDENTEARVKKWATDLVQRGCTEPVLIVVNLRFGPLAAAQFNFAYAVMNEIRKAKYPGDVMFVEWQNFAAPMGADTGPAFDQVMTIVGDPHMRDSFRAPGMR